MNHVDDAELRKYIEKLNIDVRAVLMRYIDIRSGKWIIEPSQRSANYVNMYDQMNDVTLASQTHIIKELSNTICHTMLELQVLADESSERSVTARKPAGRIRLSSTRH